MKEILKEISIEVFMVSFVFMLGENLFSGIFK